jgi:transcription initiation factor IIF auxiliary subunit
MAVDIQQGFEYQGNDWWKWWVWLEGPDEDLDRIDHVVYTLHATFPDPVRTCTDRLSKFRLQSSGWGMFTIHASVVDKDGNSFKLKHLLELEYPDGTRTTA